MLQDLASFILNKDTIQCQRIDRLQFELKHQRNYLTSIKNQNKMLFLLSRGLLVCVMGISIQFGLWLYYNL